MLFLLRARAGVCVCVCAFVRSKVYKIRQWGNSDAGVKALFMVSNLMVSALLLSGFGVSGLSVRMGGLVCFMQLRTVCLERLT